MKFRKKPVVIEAITFDELVAYGLADAAKRGIKTVKTVEGAKMAWSFNYNGHPITHETNDCYLIPTDEGVMKFQRGDMLITGVVGEIYPCKIDVFEKTYESAAAGPVTNEGAAVKAAIDCAEWLGCIAGVLKGCDKDDGCNDPECNQCVAFKLCTRYYEAMNQAGLVRPATPTVTE